MPLFAEAPSGSETYRPFLIDYFEPNFRDFELVPDERLRSCDNTLLTAVRKMFPDAAIGQREPGRLYVLSENASLAFEIPTPPA